jgi:hypothetical protein
VPEKGEEPSSATSSQPPSLASQLAVFALDIGAPIAAYYVLRGAGASNLVALAAGAVIPALAALWSLLVKRRTDGVALLVLATVVVSIVVSVVSQDPRFLLAKDGVVTGLWGLWFLASIATRRPAAFVFARPLMEGCKVFTAGSWDVIWGTTPGFRRIWRVSSVMWGIGLLVDAVTRVVMAYTLPVHVVPGLSGILWPVTFVVLQIVTNAYYHLAGLYQMLGARWLAQALGPPARPI